MLEHLIAAIGRVFYGVRTEDEGQTAVEYALVLLLVALVLVTAIALGLGGALSSAITKIKNSIG